MAELSKAVFLSYASEDAETARRISDALRAAGIEVWFDQSELRGGDAWDQKIKKQVRECGLFIAVISAHTDARPEGYFRREWKLAVDRTHDMADDEPFLLPVVVDETPDATARVPDKFREVQWTRLPGGETPQAFVERIARLLVHDPHAAPAKARPQVASVSRAGGPSWPKVVLLLIGAAAVIGGGYLAVDRLVLSKRPAVAKQASAPAVQPATSTRSTIPDKSIAVLPFVDMSEKHDQEYFADGMAEEILNLLVKIPELKVIGRTSSFSFKGKADDLRAIGKTLGAAYVVEGSVRRSADHVRVAAQLIDTRDGVHRWSGTYDRDAIDALKVQDEIAANLVRALQLEVTPSTAFPARSQPKNLETYDLYLRGLHAADKSNQSGFEEAVVNFRRVLEIDPTFVPAAEALAEILGSLAGYGMVPRQTGWQQVREAAEAVLKLDPKSAVAHAALGDAYAGYDWDWAAAERELKTAVALAPNNPLVLVDAADERLTVGQYAEAAHFLDIARAVDPLEPYVHELSCWVYPAMGRLAEAEQECRRALEVSPTLEWGRYWLGVTLLMQGKADAALAVMQKITDPDEQLFGLALAYHAVHRNKDAATALARLTAVHAQDMPMTIADEYAFHGQNDQAFSWLDKAYTQRDHNLVYIKSDPLLKNIEVDPRFKAILRKMNLPE